MRLEGPEAFRIERAMIDWFTSPFWLGDTSIVTWFDCARNSMFNVPEVVPAIAENELAIHIRHFHRPETLIHEALVSSETADGPSALVDLYMKGPAVSVATADLLLVMDACAASATPHALILFDDGVVASASIPSLLSIVLADSVRSCVKYPVAHGISRLLGTTRHKRFAGFGRSRQLLPQGAAVVDVCSLLPTITGMMLRANLIANPSSCIPVTLYPLMAALVPEVSGDLVPLIRPKGLVLSPTSPAPIWRVSRFGAALWGLSLVLSSPTGRVRRFGRRMGAWVLWRLHPVTRTSVAVRILDRFGIDSKASRGLVTRLRFGPGTNPWLTRHEKRSVRIQAASGNEMVVIEEPHSRVGHRDVEIAQC